MFPSEIVVVPVVFGMLGWVTVVRMRFKHREHMASIERSAHAGSEPDGRLARVEAAVERIALEVERIGEGQRFVTRLLSERGATSVNRTDVQGRAREDRLGEARIGTESG